MTDTTVLVAGAGPAGLSMAILLGRLGLDAIVVERREGVNPHPRARSVNVRTAEIMRQWGVLDEIEAVSLPLPWTEQFVYCETLAGTEIGRVRTGVQPVVDGAELSPVPWLLTSQDRIEEVLLRRLAGMREVQICWDTELVEVTQDSDGVAAEVRGPSGTRQLRARWLVGADGAGSRVRQSLGIEMDGIASFGTMINCQFYADLGPWTDHRPSALYWTTKPARNVFQKIDTNDRWLCQINYDPATHRPEDFTTDVAERWIRRSIGDEALSDGFDLRVTDVIPWVMSSTVAERFRDGRVFLIGDAAHQLPPTGGFGMNTAVQDAHNLAWKFASVAAGHAGERLLDTYEAERAPIAQYNADRSRENSRSVGRIRRLVESGTATIDEKRVALASSERYGNWLGMDLGLHYEDGCLIGDGTAPPPVDDPVTDYAPTARPGHRAPHVPIDFDGATSTLDLFDTQFVLLCGADVDLADAIRLGEATWQTEVRCPRLLFSAHFDSLDDRQTVEWPTDSVDWENTYLLPGMASLGMTLESSGELVAANLAGGGEIEVPEGALLARADVRRLKPLMQSLLVFRKDSELGDGQMRVDEDTTSDDPCYIVRFAADIFAESRWARDRRIAALIGAFAAMARADSRMQPGGELEHHPVTKELRSRLLAAGSPTWEEEEFECAYAATLIEPLLEQTPDDDDGDDE